MAALIKFYPGKGIAATCTESRARYFIPCIKKTEKNVRAVLAKLTETHKCHRWHSVYVEDEKHHVTSAKEEKHKAYLNVKRITTVFSGIEKAAVQLIEGCDAVFGCVAWMTNTAILNALSKKKVVSIVVQKEGYIRDNDESPEFHKNVRRLYNTIPKLNLSQCSFMTVPENLMSIDAVVDQMTDKGLMDGIRCVGNAEEANTRAFSRIVMHHKFLVCCKVVTHTETDARVLHSIEPLAVWTGSANMSKTAGSNQENAIVIEDRAVASEYLSQWYHVLVKSEACNWNSIKSNPDVF